MFLVHEMVAKKTQKNHDSRIPLPPYLGLFPKFYQFFVVPSDFPFGEAAIWAAVIWAPGPRLPGGAQIAVSAIWTPEPQSPRTDHDYHDDHDHDDHDVRGDHDDHNDQDDYDDDHRDHEYHLDHDDNRICKEAEGCTQASRRLFDLI